MNTRRWLLGMLVLGMLLVVPIAARAQSSIIVDPFTTVRFEQVILFNDDPVGVMAGYMESANRAYYTLHEFAADGSLNEVSEAVYYDGMLYIRENNATQWQEFADQPRDTLLPPYAPQDANGTLTELGSVTVDGNIPTTHYQFWFSFADDIYATNDVFVGQNDERVHRWGQTIVVQSEDETNSVAQVVRFFDFDNPTLIVAVPTDTIPGGNAAPPDTALLLSLPR